MDTKECTKCGEVKPLTEYYKHKECKGGVRPSCKSAGRLNATPTITKTQRNIENQQG